MSFLIPQVLWALPAAAIPLIIHLMSQVNTKTVDFSALRFLEEMEHESIKRLQWHQWLVMILRTMIILSLILLLARPVLRGYFQGLVGTAETTLSVVVVDDSFSMSGQPPEKSRVGSSRTEAHLAQLFEVLSNQGNQAQVLLIRASDARLLYDGSAESLPSVRELAGLLQPGYYPDRMERVLDSLSGSALQQRARLFANRELLIISDFQTHQDDPLREWAQDTTQWHDWQIFLLPVPPLRRNAAIIGARVTTDIPILGELMSIVVSVANTGLEPLTDLPIQVVLNDIRAGQLIVNLKPGQTKSVIFKVSPSRTGHQNGYAEIDSDDRSGDNRFYFHTYIPTRLRVLLLEPPGLRESYVFPALSSLAVSSPQVDLHRMPTSELTWSPQDYDVVILNRAPVLPRLLPRRLSEFLETNGKLILIPGAEPASAHVFMQIEQILGLPEISIRAEDSGTPQALDPAGTKSSFLKMAFSREMDITKAPKVTSIYPLRPGGRDELVLKLTNGRPVLVRSPVLGGHVFQFTMPFDLDWTDLPLKGSYLPMWHQLISWQPAKTALANIRVGDLPEIPVNPRQATQPVLLSGPGNISSRLIPDLRRKSVTMRGLEIPGAYTARFGQGTLKAAEPAEHFPVNVAASELSGKTLLPSQLESLVGPERAFIYREGDPVADWVTQARFGKELWRLLLYLLLLLVLAELFFANVYHSPRR